MRNIHLNDEDCFLIIKSDNSVELNVPVKGMDDNIPDNAKMTVAIAHLINDGVLDDLIKHKWNYLVDFFNDMKKG